MKLEQLEFKLEEKYLDLETCWKSQKIVDPIVQLYRECNTAGSEFS